MKPRRTQRRSVARRPKISRDFIKRERRRSFVAAVADLSHEIGPLEISVGQIVDRAKSSRNTFYELFSNRQDCLRYAVEEAADRLLAPVREVDTEKEWAVGMRDAVGGFYGAVAAEPNLAELLLLHSFAVGRGGDGDGPDGGVADLRELIARGREAADPSPAIHGPLIDEYYACGVLAVASRALLRGEAENLPRQTQEVACLIAMAYLDVSEVQRILPLR
jgi:AcrR family transcriptional regulator